MNLLLVYGGVNTFEVSKAHETVEVEQQQPTLDDQSIHIAPPH